VAAKRTKIVCTMGPSVNTLQMIQALIDAGMNAARLNFSHGTHEEHQKIVDRLKAIRKDMNVPLAIILDTKGPEVRLGFLAAEIPVSAGERYELVAEEAYDPALKSVLPLATSSILKDFVEGGSVLIDDGYLVARSCLEEGGRVFLEFQNSGKIRSRKSLNLPQVKLSLPAITDKDREDLLFAIRNDVDWIAASFIRSAEHVIEIKRFLRQNGAKRIQVIAKIENQEGLDHFDEILKVADGIMVARGDLGVEVPLSQVPRLQKMMIRKACQAGKPVITATQMLESMIQNPRPTRAEVSDVANAIHDSSSGVMLSAETAMGKYPIETVQMMSQIIEDAERDYDYHRYFQAQSELTNDVTESIAMATVKTAAAAQAHAIFCVTHSGRTARLLSRYRPSIRLFASTHDEKVYHQLALSWGVEPVMIGTCRSMEEAFNQMASLSIQNKWAEEGDLVLMTSGNPFDVSGTTNVMMVECIGRVLLRAQKGFGQRVSGKILFWASALSSFEPQDRIIVIDRFLPEMEKALSKAKGVILENSCHDNQAEEELMDCCSRLNIPVVVCHKGPLDMLKNDQWVKLDPSRALIFQTPSKV
jgi:pyruvate kinase